METCHCEQMNSNVHRMASAADLQYGTTPLVYIKQKWNIYTKLNEWIRVTSKTGKRVSVVTVTEIPPPPWWLATTEPTPPSRCFTVFSAVFLGAVSWKLPLTSAEQQYSSKCRVIPRQRAVSQSSRRHGPLSPRVRFPTQKQQDCRHSRDSLGTVVY